MRIREKRMENYKTAGLETGADGRRAIGYVQYMNEQMKAKIKEREVLISLLDLLFELFYIFSHFLSCIRRIIRYLNK